ncbi:MAG: prepilin-type N-terminal cleavage/methylation domain-containing protein [Candidatus Omnitrophota bacterium]
MNNKRLFKKRSFTLIEMLLALSIFAIVALSLYSVFSSGIRLNKRSNDVNAIYREMRWSLGRIAEDLENVVFYDFSGSYPDKTAFDGRSNEISFLAATSKGLKTVRYSAQPLGFGSVHQVIIGKHSTENQKIVSQYQEEEVARHAFVREELFFIDDLRSGQEKNSTKEVLSSNLQENGLTFSFAYLQGEGESAKIFWNNSWDKPYIPSGIRVRLTFVNPRDPQETVAMEKEIYIPTGFLGQEGFDQ